MARTSTAKKTDPERETLELSAKEIQDYLQKERTERLQSCMAEVEIVLKKHNCRLEAQPFILVDGRLGARSVFFANDIQEGQTP